MDCIKDSYACIAVAKNSMTTIEQLMEKSVQDNNALPYLKVAIKNFLENCRSPLDYVSCHIFDLHCKSKYSTKDKKNGQKRNVPKGNYPIVHYPNGFKPCMDKDFRGLESSNNKLYKLLESNQPFNSAVWLSDLTMLVNNNKHRHLTKQRKVQNLENAYLEDTNGNKFFIGSMTGANAAFVINGVALNNENVKTHPNIRTFEGKFEYEYYFEGIRKPILSLLKEILDGVSSVIIQLEREITQS